MIYQYHRLVKYGDFQVAYTLHIGMQGSSRASIDVPAWYIRDGAGAGSPSSNSFFVGMGKWCILTYFLETFEVC